MRGLKLGLAVAISVALTAYLLYSVDLTELGRQLARTHWGWVAVGIAAGLAGLFARAARWRYFFPRDVHPPGLVPAIMIGYMANNVLPLRAGEFVRIYVVARRWRQGFWMALATLIVERLLDSVSLVLILGVLVLSLDVPPIFRNAALVILAIDVVGVGALAFLAVFPATGRQILARLGRRWPALEHRLARAYDTFVSGLDGVRSVRNLPPLLAWTVVVWVLPAIAAWTTLSAVDVHLPFLGGWVVVAFVGLGISIPSAPGYIGVFHVAAAKAVELFGVNPSAGVAFALVFHASQFLMVTLVGWLYLVREGMSLSEATTRVTPADATGM